MRRKDREMNREFALALIDNSNYGILAITDENNLPYGVPLSIVRKENCLYFHSAKGGKKVDALQDNKTVCITFVGAVNVPELYTEDKLKELLTDEKKANLLGSQVFTTEFESAIVFGKIHLISDEMESEEGLRLICQKYTPSKMDYFDLAAKSGLSKTNIYRIDIEDITAKRKKFDVSGEEMKWGRMS